MRLYRCILLVLCAGVFLCAQASPARAQQGKPTLGFTTVSGHHLAVTGKGWPSRSHITVSVQSQQWVEGLVIRATRTGSFQVLTDKLDRCATTIVTAQDLNAHRVRIRRNSQGCTPRSNATGPALRVLQGTKLNPPQREIVASNGDTGDITLHVGETIAIHQPGTSQPDFVARGDSTYLALLRQGKSVLASCTSADCAGTYYWVWVAIQAGDTALDLSPACRERTPPCMRPDLGIRLHILP